MITWFSFSPRDMDRARVLVRQLQTEGVLDELGFGVLQGTLADRLYPATSTIMTRSRYLYFIPAIFRSLEAGKAKTVPALVRESRDAQEALRAVLAKNEQYGVIGRDAKQDVKRLPSNVYWAALRTLDMLRTDQTERGYLESLVERAGRERFRDDDKLLVLDEEASTWDPELPGITIAKRGDAWVVPEDADFELQPDEAQDLHNRFVALDDEVGRGPSLLRHLVDVRSDWTHAGDPAHPWDAPRLSRVPELQRLTHHARALSALARGAVLQYHQMLVEARRQRKLATDEVDLEGPFRAWWVSERERVLSWDLADFASLLSSLDSRLEKEDGEFFATWQARLASARSARQLFVDDAARARVQKRERDKRVTKARLSSAAHLAQWRPRARNDYPYELTYRHRIGVRFARDIAESLV